MKTDLVFIEALEIYATIGVYEWEQSIKQKLIFDIEMAHDNRTAAANDDLAFALNYASVSQAVMSYVESQPFLLVERVAEEVAELIQTKFGVPYIKITLRKPSAIAQAKAVGVIIERGER